MDGYFVHACNLTSVLGHARTYVKCVRRAPLLVPWCARSLHTLAPFSCSLSCAPLFLSLPCVKSLILSCGQDTHTRVRELCVYTCGHVGQLDLFSVLHHSMCAKCTSECYIAYGACSYIAIVVHAPVRLYGPYADRFRSGADRFQGFRL